MRNLQLILIDLCAKCSAISDCIWCLVHRAEQFVAAQQRFTSGNNEPGTLKNKTEQSAARRQQDHHARQKIEVNMTLPAWAMDAADQVSWYACKSTARNDNCESPLRGMNKSIDAAFCLAVLRTKLHTSTAILCITIKSSQVYWCTSYVSSSVVVVLSCVLLNESVAIWYQPEQNSECVWV